MPPPSLREDVPPGVSDPGVRRTPGTVCDMPGLDVNLTDERGEEDGVRTAHVLGRKASAEFDRGGHQG